MPISATTALLWAMSIPTAIALIILGLIYVPHSMAALALSAFIINGRPNKSERYRR